MFDHCGAIVNRTWYMCEQGPYKGMGQLVLEYRGPVKIYNTVCICLYSTVYAREKKSPKNNKDPVSFIVPYFRNLSEGRVCELKIYFWTKKHGKI